MHHGYKVIETDFTAAVTITMALRKEQLPTALLDLLKNYTQLDYSTVDEYADKLNWNIVLLPDELIQ